MKKSRQWVFGFLLLTALGIALFMAVNFLVDPTGYFSVERGAEEMNPNGYTRAVKSKYIKKHGDEYDAVILGDSKAGVLSTELLEEYTGKRYYNYYVPYGCYSDFEAFAEYLIQYTKIDEITLHLSGLETVTYSRANLDSTYQIPAIVQGGLLAETKETLDYLCRNISTSIEVLTKDSEDKNRGMDSIRTGERNYSYLYERMEEDEKSYLKEYILPRFNKGLKALFDGKDPKLGADTEGIKALQRIAKLCSENKITLKLVNGPSFISEMNKFEGEAYYEYLRKLVKIAPVWDFSGFGEDNLNPYNYANEGHYNNAAADLMLDTIYGVRQKEGFGILLTPENIETYIDSRKQRLSELKEEYEETGTVALGKKKDAIASFAG